MESWKSGGPKTFKHCSAARLSLSTPCFSHEVFSFWSEGLKALYKKNKIGSAISGTIRDEMISSPTGLALLSIDMCTWFHTAALGIIIAPDTLQILPRV